MPPHPDHTTPSPEDHKAWNGWWTLLWGLLLLITLQGILFLLILIIAYFQGVFSSGLNSQEILDQLYHLSTNGNIIGILDMVSAIIICPLCWFLGQIRPGWNGLSYLGLKKVSIIKTALWSMLLILFSVACSILFPELNRTDSNLGHAQTLNSPSLPFLLLIGTAIFIPLIEETIFRGLLWRGWRNSKLRLPGTLLITSALWAGLHIQYPGIVIIHIFFIGLILGLARESTGCLTTPLIMHGLHNSLAFLEIIFWS